VWCPEQCPQQRNTCPQMSLTPKSRNSAYRSHSPHFGSIFFWLSPQNTYIMPLVSWMRVIFATPSYSNFVLSYHQYLLVSTD
jgi:hypothetical protein